MSLPHPTRSTGFTLIEVLISLAIGMALIALGWSAYRTSEQVVRRTQVRLALHQDAGQVQHAMTGDFRTVHHGGSWRVEGQVATTGSIISVTALRATLRTGWKTADPFCASSNASWGVGRDAGSLYSAAQTPTDLTWFRWCWKADSATPGTRMGTLFRAMNPRVRNGYLGTNWTQPRRSASRPLSDNDWQTLFQTASTTFLTRNNPLSDEADLSASLVPIAFRVRDFAVAWTTSGGAVSGVDAASLTTSLTSHPIDGVWLDARDSTLPRLRPAVLRMRFTLVDPAADLSNDPNALGAGIVQQTFVWSVPLTPLAQP
jgi:prepilin-type N-terminal cleavage/methylation domain-containing protein